MKYVEDLHKKENWLDVRDMSHEILKMCFLQVINWGFPIKREKNKTKHIYLGAHHKTQLESPRLLPLIWMAVYQNKVSPVDKSVIAKSKLRLYFKAFHQYLKAK